MGMSGPGSVRLGDVIVGCGEGTEGRGEGEKSGEAEGT